MKTPIAELFQKFGHLLPDVENEYLEKEKKLLQHPTITDTEIERMAKEFSMNNAFNSSFIPDVHSFITGAKAVLSMMPQSEGWVKVEECDTMYCNCKHPTLGSSISRCGTCDNWFNPLPHPPKNKI